MADKVTETIVLTPETCPCCGEGLENVTASKTKRHYKMEIPIITPTVTEHVSEEKTCPGCGGKISAEFPHESKAPQQYGPNLKAFIVMLAEMGMVSMNRIVEMVEAITGIKISEGTVANTIEQCAENLEEVVNEIKETIKGAKVVHFDETGMRIQGRLTWLHTASTKILTYLNIQAKRGKEAMDAIGVLNNFKGIAVHDCLASYFQYSCIHSLCNAHLLRELIFIYQRMHQSWAKKMIDLLLEIKEAVEARLLDGKTFLLEEELSEYIKRYSENVEEGLEINPEQPKPIGKRGRAKQSKARLLLLRLQKWKDEYLRFAFDFICPFDNNQAERDIRMPKVKQKVSGCFRSLKGGKSFATIYSFIQTLKKNRVPVFGELVKVFKGDYSFPFQLVTE